MPKKTVLHVDPEHNRLRLAVIGVLLLVFVVMYPVLVGLLQNQVGGTVGDYALSLACVGALLLSLGAGALAENLGKRNWHSGKKLILDQKQLSLHTPNGREAAMEWGRRITVTKWYFYLKGFPRGGRERRVPGSWTCLACRLRQDNQDIIVHGYLPPVKAESLVSDHTFHRIRPADFYEGTRLRRLVSAPERPSIPNSVLTGEDGPFWLAERRRWTEGLELAPDDFRILITYIYDHLAE